MSDLSESNPHLGLWASENYVSPGERAWLSWVAKVEKALGHDLDGDQEQNGYSQDYSYDMFENGYTVADAVREIKENPKYCVRTD